MDNFEYIILSSEGRCFGSHSNSFFELANMDNEIRSDFINNYFYSVTINGLDFTVIVIKNYSTIDEILEISKKEPTPFCAVETYNSIYFCKHSELRTILKRVVENLDYEILSLFGNSLGKIEYNSDKRVINELLEQITPIRSSEVFWYQKSIPKIQKINYAIYPDSKKVPFDYCEFTEDIINTENTGTTNLAYYVGNLYPVYKVDKLFQDCLSSHVYKSFSSRKLIENDFSVHGGKGKSSLQAYTSAVGEAYERYSSRLFDYDKSYIVLESYSKLNVNELVINPKKLILDDNYINEYTPDKLFEWVKVTNLTKKQKYYIPANTIFFPYDRSLDLMLHSQSTTGLSAETTLEKAVLKGLLEVIERDSYSIVHKAQLKVKKIKINTIKDKEIASLVNDLSRLGFKIHLTLISQVEFTYVVHCTLEHSTKPLFTHGSGASLEINIAISRAIHEAVQLRTSQVELLEYPDLDDSSPRIAWANGKKKYFELFLESNAEEIVEVDTFPTKSKGNIVADIEYIISELENLDFEVFCANLTRNDSPLKCVRIIIPGFQDIDPYNTRMTPRLYLKLSNNDRGLNLIEMFN